MLRYLVLAAIAVALGAVFYISQLPWSMTDRPETVDLGPVPAQLNLDRLDGLLIYNGVVVPRPAGTAMTQGLRLGYSYRAFDALKMPFVASREFGPVVYRDTPRGQLTMPVEGDHADDLAAQTGFRWQGGYSFPWWEHMWGWLFVAALGFWFWLQTRADARARAESGVL